MSLTKDLTKQFKLFATLMQLDGANSFKIIAYDKAVRALQESDLDLEQHLEDKTLTSIDVIAIGLYFSKGIYFVSLLYGILLIPASRGFWTWYKAHQKQTHGQETNATVVI